MHTCFIVPPHIPMSSIDVAREKNYVPYHPLSMPMGVLYLSSYLKQQRSNCTVSLIDFPLLLDQVVQYPNLVNFIAGVVDNHNATVPDIVGVSLQFATSFPFFKLMLPLLRKRWPEAVLVVGGIQATSTAEYLLQNESLVDYVVLGEGERAFADLVSALESGQHSDIKIKGVYRTKDYEAGMALVNADYVDDIDTLPFPDWELLDFDRYLRECADARRWDMADKKLAASMITTRGCPNHCAYCSAWVVHGRRVRCRSKDNVIEEMSVLQEKYGVSIFIPQDDYFTFQPNRVLSLLDAIKELPGEVELQFPNALNINSLNDDLLAALLECGTREIKLAVESGSPQVQKDIIKKNVNLERAREVVRYVHEHGGLIRCNFIFGFPGETWEMRNESVEYIINLGADWCAIHIATPLPGSEMYTQMVARGDIQDGPSAWENASVAERTFDTVEVTAEEINKFRYRVNLEVNFIHNRSLKEGNWSQALSVFEDVLWRYPFHVFAHYGCYKAMVGMGDMKAAEERLQQLAGSIRKDQRAAQMYDDYSELIPIEDRGRLNALLQ